ncbi:MAG: right-handed parallel beta-helix repeat-containing protein, partial [Alistipes sp.]|nr:right-handed parallel beta-helix repeat-containing protein [Alistipes sp.]
AVNGTLSRAEGRTFEGETFKLSNDLDLNNDRWTPIGATGNFLGTFDGGNFTIYNLLVSERGTASAGLFADGMCTIKNLTVKNAEIYGHYKAGVIVGDGLCTKVENCHVDGAKVVVTPYEKDDANNVGGIVGFLSADGGAAYVKNCSVKNAEITAYRKVGGIVGAATGSAGAVITGNTVEKVKVVADQTAEYDGSEIAYVDTILGCKVNDKVVLENNTATESTAVVMVNTAANIEYQANNATCDIAVVFGDNITGDAIIKQREGVNVVVDGAEKNYTGTIYIHGAARHDKAETLNIENVKFVATGKCDFISSNTTASAERYAHNVTIQNCEFIGTDNLDVVGARFRQAFNITIKDCKATNVHSLLQATGGKNIIVDGVEVKGKSGISFGTSTDCSVKNSTVEAIGYGVRVDGTTNSLVVENSNLAAYIPITVRSLTADNGNFDLVLNGNELVKGGLYHVALCSNEFEEGVTPEAPKGTYTVTGADNYAVFPINANGNYTDEEGNTVAQTGTGFKEAVKSGNDVVLGDDISMKKSEGESNAYGTTGVNQTNGGTIDGNGNSFGVSAWSTWDSAISTTGGTIKNITINSGMRGIFVNHNSDNYGKVYLENVTIDGTVYTISCDQGTNSGLEATNCVINGWTSYAATIGDVKFTNCSFGEGQGYAFCRPYAPTTFVGCEFKAGYEMDPRAKVVFVDCTFDGVALTPANVDTLVTSNVANAKFEDEYGNTIVNTVEDIKEAIAEEGATVKVMAGEYSFPASSIAEGVTIKCEEGTVFTGTSSLNIKGATVEGATFKNDGGQAVSGTINGNFKDCTFEGHETLRWCYTKAGETTVFENCVIKTSFRGIHFDEMNGDVIFRNCEINGFNAYSGTGSMTFENCTFGNDASRYNGLNIYTNTTIKDCTFNFVSGKTNFIDMEGTGKTLTIINCTATLDGAAANVADFVGGSKLDQNTVIYE